MADWYIQFYERYNGGYGTQVGEYSLMEPTAEIRNSEPGGFAGTIALSQKKRNQPLVGIGRDEFAPYRTLYQLWRQSTGNGVCISGGLVTSINLSFNRDTILVGGKDWIHYLERRIYPFDPDVYTDQAGWVQWPRQWPDIRGVFGPRDYIDNPTLFDVQAAEIDMSIIIRELIQSMRFDPPEVIPDPANYPRGTQWPAGVSQTNGSYPIVTNIPLFGQLTKYKIYPGDSTTIYDHLRKLSEQAEKGFEFDINPLSLEFRVWNPRRDSTQAYPWYVFFGNTMDEEDGAITAFDWTNDGPDATYLVGLGSADHKVGTIWTNILNPLEFGRLDAVHDFGEIQNRNLILQMLKDQNDMHPQKKLQLQILNPEFHPLNFYTGGRPRNLLGARVGAFAEFPPYHTVNADFRINAIKWTVDQSTNEYVDLELEMVYEP